MESSDVQACTDPGAGRRKFLKACGVTALAAGATPLISSCISFGSSKPAGFDVLAEDWLGRLAVAIGAGFVPKILGGGLKGSWAAWEPEVETVGEDVLEYGLAAAAASYETGGSRRPAIFDDSAMSGRYRFIPGRMGYAHPVPPVVFLRVSQDRHGDPHTDMMIAFVDHGTKHIIFKPWAWQALSLFVNYLTANQDPANLSVARAVCVLTLIPAGTQPQTGRIPGGLVDFYNYKSRNGNVKMALVQESNGGPTGVITASAIPGGNGKPLVKSFRLPVQPSGMV
jgi:hypothetical protein